MSQTWHGTLLTTDTLSDSRGYINDMLATLRSSWSGATAPGSPVAGQLFLDTDDNVLYVYNGAAWKVIGDADADYLSTLPLAAGSSYALTGDLYLGTHQVKGVTDPTLSTDAATKNYTDTTFLAKGGGTMTGDITCGANNITMDHNPTLSTHLVRKAYADLFEPLAGGTWTADHPAGGYKLTGLGTPTAAADASTKSYVDGKFDLSSGHDHDGVDSRKALWTDLKTTGASAGNFLVADGSEGCSAFTPFAFDSKTSATWTEGSPTWHDACEVTLYVPRTTSRIVWIFWIEQDGGLQVWSIRFVDGAETVLFTPASTIDAVYSPVCWSVVPGAVGNYTLTAQVQITGAQTIHCPALFAICIG